VGDQKDNYHTWGPSGWREVRSFMYAPTNSLVSGSPGPLTITGGSEDFIVASAYLPYDRRTTADKGTTGRHWLLPQHEKQHITGCDATAHHILWGSTGTNPRGETFTEYLASSNLNILNQGNELTFVVRNRMEVTTLTLGTN
jgi:hypothetical protein